MTDAATAVPDTVADEPIDPKGYILLRRDDAIATVTINRPAQRNAISFAMWGQLTELMRELDADRDVRCVVIAGAGGEAFSAGADISDFDEYRSDSTKGRIYNRAVDGLLETVAVIGTPVISMIRSAKTRLRESSTCSIPSRRRKSRFWGEPAVAKTSAPA